MIGCFSHAPNWGPAGPATQACALTGNQTGDLSVCRLALNPLSHTSQGWVVSNLGLSEENCIMICVYEVFWTFALISLDYILRNGIARSQGKFFLGGWGTLPNSFPNRLY